MKQIDVANLNRIRVGIVQEGFGLENSELEVDTLVKDAAMKLSSAGAKVEEVSIPMHKYSKFEPTPS